MARGRRALAIGVSIAVHALIGAVFVSVRPKVVIERGQVSVRIVAKPAPELEPVAREPVPDVARGSIARVEKKQGVKSVLPEGPVTAEEASPQTDPTLPSSETLARRESVGNSGTVRSDRVDLDLKIDPSKAATGELYAGGPTALRREGGGGPDLKPSGGGAHTYEDSTFEATIQADGTVELEDKVIPIPRVGINDEGQPSIEIPLDLTDTLLRAGGDDPYAYEKRKFLAATQELRAQMAEEACKENLDASLLDIKPRMLAIWRNAQLSHGEKKRRLFALWDECAEDGSADILRTSELIRASILGFIAEHMPPESHLAYSETDLTQLNAKRRSRAEFLPYGRSPTDR